MRPARRSHRTWHRSLPAAAAAASFALLAACADVTPIEDGKSYGPVVALQDFFTSCHLVRTGPSSAVLVDACWRPDELRSRLAAQGLEPSAVTHVLFTHGHQDHVGGLEVVAGAQVLGLEAEQSVLAAYAKVDAKIDQLLADGEELVFGDVTVRVYAMPGHTPGSAAYLVDRTLVLGDAGLFEADGDLAPPPEDRSDDPAAVVRALVALSDRLVAEERTIDWVVPAHSGGRAGSAALTAFADANR